MGVEESNGLPVAWSFAAVVCREGEGSVLSAKGLECSIDDEIVIPILELNRCSLLDIDDGFGLDYDIVCDGERDVTVFPGAGFSRLASSDFNAAICCQLLE